MRSEALVLLCVLFLVPSLVGAASPVDSLLLRMSLEEKIGQMNLLTSDWDTTGPSVRPEYVKDVESGAVGAVFNAYTAAFTRKLQERAVKGSRLGIPLLFGYDVIHGHRCIFPIPLAEAASWNVAAVQRAARISAVEATAEGIHWTFAPMVDVARDPRWGRIAESAGEDVWLGGLYAAARVRGLQGQNLRDRDSLLACPKHFAAYGAAQAGRDYHTVDVSRRSLEETYLPPFRAAVEAGAATIMTAFNELAGVPCSAHDELIGTILRKRWGFTGFVVSDYTSINELVPHGFARDEKEAGDLAARAGVDMDMQGRCYARFLKEGVEKGRIPMSVIDEAARRILSAKERLGLLDDPYRYCDEARERRLVMSAEHRAFARSYARLCPVLLKNEGDLLPLDPKVLGHLAVVGPLADSRKDMIGSWHAAGDGEKAVSLLDDLKARFAEGGPKLHVARGCAIEGQDRSGFDEAIEAANHSDLVLAVMGESRDQSGEAASRTDLSLPGVQEELLRKLVATGKPVVLLLMSGRPLTIPWAAERVPTIMQCWFLGTEAGSALGDLLVGAASPVGRLPVTWPRSVGQIPIHYDMKNTGRPIDPKRLGEKYRSRYLDGPNSPQWPFGHGLTYTRFVYEKLECFPPRLRPGRPLSVTVTLRNAGKRQGQECVQLYLHDPVASVTRPVAQLRGFRRVDVAPGASLKVRFTLTEADWTFLRRDMTWGTEPGVLELRVGPDAVAGPVQTVKLLPPRPSKK